MVCTRACIVQGPHAQYQTAKTQLLHHDMIRLDMDKFSEYLY